MKLKLIGKNSDDVGKQLEDIVVQILKHKAISDISTNIVGSGANELDVTGTYTLPTGQKRKLICECKAYSKPLSLPDWEKFCGKLYLEKSRRNNQDVYGILIAFSGINGNVKGSFEEYNLSNDNISIYSGDHLYEILKEIYYLKNIEVIIAEIQKYTTRKYSEIFLTFYNNQCYWVIKFLDSTFSLLSTNGLLIQKSELEIQNLIEALKWLDENLQFISLEEEFEKEQSIKNLTSEIISNFIDSNFIKTKVEIEKYQNNSEITNVTIENLINTGIIYPGKDDTLTLNTKNKKIDILKNLLIGRFPLRILNTKNYESIVDHELLDLIISIQKMDFLNQEERNEVLSILKLSPSAIYYSINPDPMISNDVNDPIIEIYENVIKFKRDYFFRNLYKHLKNDFQNTFLAEHFYTNNKINEIEENISYKIKSKNEVLYHREIVDRTGIAQMTDGKKIYIKILPDIKIPDPLE
ncbi:hypothetical protein [Leptospira bandrabouensis]|uniref:Restriction endonuclease type IV Mrr domain-containing protein n=1 Tax=Leptospira bandrabouensis TaxID=2484903 RepID=A0A6H3NNZ9_9LEPT|nr:hypothetical protein [Leptospira bandrabouensis]TGN13338.1 hypothetical protein EHR08_11700 [Leptospira bandrabouensis]